MNIFAEDGPEPLPRTQDPEKEHVGVQAKQTYLKHFMVDFIEFKLRKVVTQNTIFCADRCALFTDIMDEDLTVKEQRQQMSCFEKCIGKHTDGLDLALSTLSEHLKNNREKEIVRTKKDGYLLGQNAAEPVYDKPAAKKH